MTENPLQKYVDAIDNPTPYVQAHISQPIAQYFLKALDYLHIYAQKFDQPEIIEPALHEEAEGIVTDILLDGTDG